MEQTALFAGGTPAPAISSQPIVVFPNRWITPAIRRTKYCSSYTGLVKPGSRVNFTIAGSVPAEKAHEVVLVERGVGVGKVRFRRNRRFQLAGYHGLTWLDESEVASRR